MIGHPLIFHVFFAKYVTFSAVARIFGQGLFGILAGQGAGRVNHKTKGSPLMVFFVISAGQGASAPLGYSTGYI